MSPGRCLWNGTFPALTSSRSWDDKSPLWANFLRPSTAEQRECWWRVHVWEPPSIQWDISKYPFQVVETREDVLTGHKASSPDIEQTAGKTSSVFYIEDHSKVCLNRHQSGEIHGLTSLKGWLESGFIGLRPAVCPVVLSHYEKEHSRQRQRDHLWEEKNPQESLSPRN